MPKTPTVWPFVDLAALWAECTGHGSEVVAPGDDQRRHPRTYLWQPARLQELNDRFRPIGEVELTEVRDVSLEGVGLRHRRELTANYLLLAAEFDYPGHRVISLLEVIRCRREGDLFEVGTRLLQEPVDCQGVLGRNSKDSVAGNP